MPATAPLGPGPAPDPATVAERRRAYRARLTGQSLPAEDVTSPPLEVRV